MQQAISLVNSIDRSEYILRFIMFETASQY